MAEISEERYENLESELEEIKTNYKESVLDNADTKQVEKDEKVETISNESDITSRTADQEYVYTEYIELGLGDLAFFGTLISFALIKLGFFSAIAAFIGVIIGAIGTIKLLEKVKMMPGLPLSIGIGLVLSFGVWGILTLTGYDGWGYVYPVWTG
jgi:hypothetical protein